MTKNFKKQSSMIQINELRVSKHNYFKQQSQVESDGDMKSLIIGELIQDGSAGEISAITPSKNLRISNDEKFI